MSRNWQTPNARGIANLATHGVRARSSSGMQLEFGFLTTHKVSEDTSASSNAEVAIIREEAVRAIVRGHLQGAPSDKTADAILLAAEMLGIEPSHLERQCRNAVSAWCRGDLPTRTM